MSQVVQALGPHPDPAAIEAFLAEGEFPRVEGRAVTFVWRGDADRVELVHWIHGLEQAQPFQRLAGTDLWFHVLDLPRRSRMEYKLAIHHGGRTTLERDPLNPHLAQDPFGANSVVRGDGYEPPEWAEFDDWARHGEMRRIAVDSRAFGERRVVDVYLPAYYRRTRRYPLLIAHDGPDYVQFASLVHVLDNLIHRHEIPPMIVAMTRATDRMQEYAADRRHSDFLVDELLPTLDAELPLVPDTAARGLLGASFGAVASLACAWHRPGVFGRLMLQSGSFVFTDIGDHGRGPIWDPVVEFVNAFRKTPGLPAERIHLSCGVYEGLIYYNRSLVPLLQDTGAEVRFLEARDGHNWENWRDHLRSGLTWLFPGPLWMTYE